MKITATCLIAAAATLCAMEACNERPGAYDKWEVYGGGKQNIRYSSLHAIDTGNVQQLQVAWTYHTGDSDRMTQIQVNPIVIDTVLFGVSPKLKLFALNAATGKQKWVFDPVDTTGGKKGNGYFQMNVCRGVTYYRGNQGSDRIFFGASSYLYCIDANTGRPIASFGENGRIDLHNDLGPDARELYIAATTPGIIYKDMIIIGGRVSEENDAAPGHIRAYDVNSGKLRWIFHTIPQPGQDGFDSWDDKEAYQHVGGANSWSGFSLDEEKGILFAPTGSASYDFYGGSRTGANLYANCILALDANTGKRIWHFQTVHHDVWDRDLPTAPMLVTIKKDGKSIEAIAQPTKSGFIFLFERATGKPVYPIEERPVETVSELAGEKLAPTQPFPTFPAPFARQSLSAAELNTTGPDSVQQDIRNRFATYQSRGLFNPPSPAGTVIFPGFDGGAEWGGPAFDPETGIMYVNANEMAWILTMVKAKEETTKKETNLEAGQRLYTNTCMQCHGPDRKGTGNFPTLIGAEKKYSQEQFFGLLNTGRRMMPAFAQLDSGEKQAIASFVLNQHLQQSMPFAGTIKKGDPRRKMIYTSTGYNKFLTSDGYPAIAPPWGTINAINLNTGELVWKNPLGEYPELKAKGVAPTGTENYGGPVVTKGGLVFIAASRDGKIRAYHKRTGQLLWEATLPAPGFATPAVYEVNGVQYLVIACGGGKLKTASGDAYVAFALPPSK